MDHVVTFCESYPDALKSWERAIAAHALEIAHLLMTSGGARLYADVAISEDGHCQYDVVIGPMAVLA